MKQGIVLLSFLLMSTVSLAQYGSGYGYGYGISLKEFENIQYGNLRCDASVGILGNTYMGNVSNTLGGGFGGGSNVMLYGRKGWGGGMLVNISGVHQKHQGSSLGIKLSTGSIMSLAGFAVGKIFNGDGDRQYSLQFEGCIGTVNFAKPDATFGSTMTIARGFIPGIKASYLLPLGPGKMLSYGWMPATYRCFVDLHFTVRQMMLNESAVNGMMFEAGVSFRLSTRPVINYTAKSQN